MQIILQIFEHFQNAPGGPVVPIFAYLIIILALTMLIIFKYFGTLKKQKPKNLLAKKEDAVVKNEILPKIITNDSKVEEKISETTTDDFQTKEISPGIYSYNHNESTLAKISTGYKKIVDTLKAGEYQMPTLNSEEFSFFG